MADLHAAAAQGDTARVRALVNAGADVRYVDGKDTTTALFIAAWNGHADAVEELLRAGADMNHLNWDGASPLDIATLAGRHNVVNVLRRAGAVRIRAGKEMLEAVASGSIAKVHAAIENGAELRYADPHDGATALHIAVRGGKKDIVDALIAAGANVQAEDMNGLTPLLVAASSGHAQAVDALIRARADVHKANKIGSTALHFASLHGHKEIVDALVRAGAPVQKVCDAGRTPLHVAARAGHNTIIDALIAAGVQVNTAANDGTTPLINASCAGKLEAVKSLLSAGAFIDRKDNNGVTALECAIQNNHGDVAAALREAAAQRAPPPTTTTTVAPMPSPMAPASTTTRAITSASASSTSSAAKSTTTSASTTATAHKTTTSAATPGPAATTTASATTTATTASATTSTTATVTASATPTAVLAQPTVLAYPAGTFNQPGISVGDSSSGPDTTLLAGTAMIATIIAVLLFYFFGRGRRRDTAPTPPVEPAPAPPAPAPPAPAPPAAMPEAQQHDERPHMLSGSANRDTFESTSSERLRSDEHLQESFAAMPLPLPSTHIKKIRKLGVGGMGVVFLGTYHGAEVVIKQIHPQRKNAKLEQQFLREIEMQSRLNHPNIVYMFGVAKDGDTDAWLLLAEYCKMGSLADVIYKDVTNDALTPQRRLDMLAQAASGMAYLHRSKVLHSDLKPDNILVTDNWTVKIADYGLSMVLGTTIGYKRRPGGLTLHYAAPETLRDEPVSLPADVFSFAITMWEVWTMSTPYADKNHVPPHRFAGLVASDLGLFRPTIDDKIPEALAKLMRAGWDNDPSKRPTFAELHDKLAELASATSQAAPAAAVDRVAQAEAPFVIAQAASHDSALSSAGSS